MNCYDFDNTIYRGDSSIHFYTYCLVRYPKIWRHLPAQLCAFVRYYLLHKGNKTEMKDVFYRYLPDIPDLDRVVQRFWDKRFGHIKPFYLEQKQADDVIISASPEFFLAPVCKRLGVGLLLGSRVDAGTGLHDGLNCHGEEKVRRLFESLPQAAITTFYSDSLSDSPLARLAEKAYLVKGDRVYDWPAM
ncbi:MAG: hypothetical protein E7402_02910 [Ruminococcaceae bacterium]|nr:hypothetical protein [Oscillospiraceae bacterium]